MIAANSTVAYEERYFLKLFRRLEWGRHPEEDSTRYLNEARGFTHIAPHAGTLQYREASGHTATAALLLGFVQNQGDAWSYTVDACGRFLERVIEKFPRLAMRLALTEAIGAIFPERARQLGQRVAELHLAFAGDANHAVFAPEPFTSLYQRSLYQAVRGNLLRTTRLLKLNRPSLPEEVRAAADELLAAETALMDRHNVLLRQKVVAAKTSIHGSLHLGQVLNTGKDFVIVDLEGDASRPLSERSLKRSPLVDVASMLRSFDFAAYAALRRQPQDAEILRPWVQAWTAAISERFLSAYFETASEGKFLPASDSDRTLLLEVFLIDRALAEVTSELASRPEMAIVPIRALLELSRQPAGGGAVA